MKLSDAYLEETAAPMLELTVKVININLPVNHPILEKCRPLYEYAWFIQKIREYQENGESLSEAVTHAIESCKEEEIMAEFMREHGSEAVNMLFTQFNMEDALEVRYEEGIEKGLAEGHKKAAEQMAIRMLSAGKLSVEEIAGYITELTVDEIEALRSGR